MRDLFLKDDVLIQEIVKDQHLEIEGGPVQKISVIQSLETEKGHHLEEKTDIEGLDLKILINLEDLGLNLSFVNMQVNQRENHHPVPLKVHSQLKSP